MYRVSCGETATGGNPHERRQEDYEVFIGQKNGDKTYYTKIGAAWEVAKGGISVKLTALPVDGSIVLFPRKDGDEQ